MPRVTIQVVFLCLPSRSTTARPPNSSDLSLSVSFRFSFCFLIYSDDTFHWVTSCVTQIEENDASRPTIIDHSIIANTRQDDCQSAGGRIGSLTPNDFARHLCTIVFRRACL